MIIIFKNDSLLNSLFPELNISSSNEEKIRLLKEQYSYGPHQPIITIDDEIITIEIDIENLSGENEDFDKVIKFCNSRKFDLAKPILQKLIRKNPSVSEYHRILGQIHFEENEIDEAQNELLEALKWDPQNKNALIMMGNLFAKFREDYAAALKFYNEVIGIDPDDYIALCNIAANLLKAGKSEEAKSYLDISEKIAPNYTNTLYALALYYDNISNYEQSFNYSIKSLKSVNKSDDLYKYSLEQTLKVMPYLINEDSIRENINNQRDRIEQLCSKPVRIEKDDQINTVAKIELAESYNRQYHIIKYKGEFITAAHFIIHEVLHLEMIIQNRINENNIIVRCSEANKNEFLKNYEKSIGLLQKQGLNREKASEIMVQMLDGLLLQLYNTPFNILLEHKIYSEFPSFRSIQFTSLMLMTQNNINAVTNKQINYLPQNIVSSSKILNLVTAFHLKQIFGLDYISEHKATKEELNIANSFFKDILETGFYPGLENELVQKWGKELNLEKYYTITDENEFRFMDNIYSELKQHPNYTPSETDTLKVTGNLNYQMSVTMYCLDALREFKDFSKDQIRNIGFEIAVLGMRGIDPNDKEKRYKLTSLNNREFSGLQLLAYMYVAWQEIDNTKNVGMDFSKEYIQAKELFFKS